MSKIKIGIIIIFGILSFSGNTNDIHFSDTSLEMMNPLEFTFCDDDGFAEIDIVNIENQVLQSFNDGNGSIEEAVLISTSMGHVIRLNNLSGTITVDVICDMPNFLSDIAVDENGDIFITDFSTITKLDDVFCTTSSLPNIPSVSFVNSLSFDTQGNLYFGGGDDSVVYRYNNDQLSSPYIWHDFNNGFPSGDFVILNGKMYISWNLPGSIRLYEVTLDSNFNYISHVDLGEILPATWGLASELGVLYGVTVNELYKIDLNSFTFTTIITNDLPYGIWGGAAGLHEAVAYEVSSYISNEDATNGVNPLPNIWTNTQQGGQTIYIRIENTLTGTLEIIEVDIVIYDNIPDLTIPTNLADCESDGNPMFNLSDIETELLQNVTHPVTVSYHISQAHADNNTNPLNTTYELTTDQQTIYVRVQNDNNECFATSQFTVSVSNSPTVVTPSDLFQCEDQGNDVFTLTDVETEMLQNNTNPVTVSYHNSLDDAEMNLNPINTNYQISTLQETIFVRVESTENNNCYETTQFTIQISQNPIVEPFVNSPSLRLLSNCYTDSNLEGYFNLNDIYSDIITDGNTDYNLAFYPTESNAELNINNIDPIYYASGDTQEIFVVVTNTNGCKSITNFFINPDCYDTIVDMSNIYFPAFFTPNNDFINDTWNVRGISVQQTSIMYIFDRFGKLLYYFRPRQIEGWDGTYRGKPMPSSDYWYTFETAEGQTYNGHFSLIR